MKVQFFNTYDGVLEAWPIEPMAKAIPNWVRSARDDFVSTKHDRRTHVYKCSGIGELYKTGFVVRAWHDFYVDADERELKVTLPSSGLSDRAFDIQHGDTIAKFIPRRPWSSKTILKLNTPWHVIAPCKLLMLPVSYPDSHVFESCIGILDPAISTELNIQLFWNALGCRTQVNAGTPLCQLVPICDEAVELEVRNANPKDIEWLKKRHYIINMAFTSNIKKMKEMYHKLWS